MYIALCTSEENTILGLEISFLSVFIAYLLLTFKLFSKNDWPINLPFFFLEYSPLIF